MTYKIEKTSFTTQTGTYQVYETWEIPISISGSMANGTTRAYVAGFTFTEDNAKARFYLRNSDGLKAPMTTGVRIATYSPTYEIYDFASTEVCETDVYYDNSGAEVYGAIYLINNTGGTVNLVTQEITMIAEFYDGPVA